jgi:hypothetical protein
MEIDQCEIIQLELKYCERCGGLWMRERGSELRYCPPCASQLALYPVPRKRGPKARLPRNVTNSAGLAIHVCAGGTA